MKLEGTLHGNHGQLPIIWLDGAGTYLGQMKLERSGVCLVVSLFSGWFGSGNIPPYGRRLIWLKTTVRGVSKQPHWTLPLFFLFYAQCLSFSQGMWRVAGETWSTQNEFLITRWGELVGRDYFLRNCILGPGTLLLELTPPWPNHWSSAHLYPVKDYLQLIFFTLAIAYSDLLRSNTAWLVEALDYFAAMKTET